MKYRSLLPQDSQIFFEHSERTVKNSDTESPPPYTPLGRDTTFSDTDKERWEKGLETPPEQNAWVRTWGAFLEEKLIGVVILKGSAHQTQRHRAYLSIGIEDPELRGQGIGKELMQLAINWTKKVKHLEWIDLTVFETNYKARSLYFNCGFTEIGLIPDHFQFGEQKYSQYMMSLSLKPKSHKIIPNDLCLDGIQFKLVPSSEQYYSQLQTILSDTQTMNSLLYMSKKEQGGWTMNEIRARELKWKARQVSDTGVHFLITPKGNPSLLLGSCGLTTINFSQQVADYGVIIHHPYWGSGACTETKLLVLQYAFETLKLNRVQFSTSAKNTRNRALKEKLGISLEGIFKELYPEDNHFQDSARYALLAKEWPEVKRKLKERINKQIK